MESLLLMFILFMIVLECTWQQDPCRDEEELRHIERRLHDNIKKRVKF